MSDIIKPDFESIAASCFSDGRSVRTSIELFERFWKENVEPLLSTVKRLQEEKKELVDALKAFVEGIGGVSGYEHFEPLINNANDVLKSSELNK